MDGHRTVPRAQPSVARLNEASYFTMSHPDMPEASTLAQPFAGLKFRAATFVRRYPREALGFGLLAAAAATAIGGVAQSTPELPGHATTATQVAPPAAPPLLIRQLAPDQALQVNAGIPLTADLTGLYDATASAASYTEYQQAA